MDLFLWLSVIDVFNLYFIYRYIMIAHHSIYARIYRKNYIVLMIAFCWLFSYGFQLPTLFKVWGKQLLFCKYRFWLLNARPFRPVWVWLKVGNVLNSPRRLWSKQQDAAVYHGLCDTLHNHHRVLCSHILGCSWVSRDDSPPNYIR